MLSRSIEVPRSARYCLSREPHAGVRELWFLLHGYAELASEFLEGFRAIASAERLLVAPEGLSRFYRRGSSGPVGASWMTREAREQEIDDYVRYLDALRAELRAELTLEPMVCVLGFSQGTATAARWVARGERGVQRLILWGGAVPPDLDLAQARARLAQADLTHVFGSRDAYVRAGAVREEAERLQGAGIPSTSIRFEGGHAIDSATLAELVRR